MEKIHSKIDTNKLLHVICRLSDVVAGRQNLIEADNFIQCSSLCLDKGQTFKPHKHIRKQRTNIIIAQESWHVIQGSVRCIFYDIDDTIIETVVLQAGDSSFTLEGGHNYEILEDNTKVMEYKTGPYEGQQLDKEFIES